ncbi:hypothetical protein [Pseudoroseicyclus sp. CXY001]|uniref:hypothetical protein n=1 Tax=Pseudoroseicyclus sp. CXY001 TaxID=3242492 RepID=UPI0035713C62
MRHLAALLLLAACAAPPELPGPAPDLSQLPATELTPLGPLLAEADAPPAADPGPGLSAEAAALAARAAAIRARRADAAALAVEPQPPTR